MKDATKYANDIAKKENDKALEAVRKTGKTEIITLTPEREGSAWKKALLDVHKENEVTHGQGHASAGGVQGNRLQTLAAGQLQRSHAAAWLPCLRPDPKRSSC